ncbi:SH3 domain-binding protein 5 homolog [Agrilus planipennis]|uniref:SH3 domain-binding protein 5 homolog n=1 Tax=Agrilus planipennis TaxID=224129 RepID=A0A1W4W8G6_AGRPL|nr:SH3 domain-binding protein 5 homolog [Agrilus planipennis]
MKGNISFVMEEENNELDPRIQIELEKLNTETDEINKLELELDEANTAFRMILNDSSKKLKALSKKIGVSINRSRPYFDALDVAKKAQQECQKAAIAFQRANEIHAAAKETVALAEQRFMSNRHEWQFDNAWQEMLNHATIKVMEAEHQKAESGKEHQKRATLFEAAKQKVHELDDRLHRHILKSRPYFEQKTLCEQQLNTQKEVIESLQHRIFNAKKSYAEALKKLEQISNEIHMKRKGLNANEDLESDILNKPREPGVGAELGNLEEQGSKSASTWSKHPPLPNISFELDKCEIRSMASLETTGSSFSEKDDVEVEDVDDLRLKVKQLATRPIDGGEGKSTDEHWESELKNTVDKLDHMLLMQECAKELDSYKSKRKREFVHND